MTLDDFVPSGAAFSRDKGNGTKRNGRRARAQPKKKVGDNNFTRGGDRTHNLLVRNQTPYPLGHAGTQPRPHFLCMKGFTFDCISVLGPFAGSMEGKESHHEKNQETNSLSS